MDMHCAKTCGSCGQGPTGQIGGPLAAGGGAFGDYSDGAQGEADGDRKAGIVRDASGGECKDEDVNCKVLF